MKNTLDLLAACLILGIGGTLALACYLATRIWFWLGALTITLILQGGITT